VNSVWDAAPSMSCSGATASGPRPSALLPGKRGHESKVPLLDADREQLLSACIQEFYLKPERPRLAALMLEVRRRFAEQRLPAPNYRTVVRRVEALDLRLATAKREGSKKARQLLGRVAISTLRPNTQWRSCRSITRRST
jgi:hypothetical protein